MELFVILMFLVVVPSIIAGGVYAADPKGWQATIKRVSGVARASLEAKKGVPALGAKHEQKALDEWTQAFEGKDVTLAVQPKHYIVKRGYYKTINYGMWPEWTCACGVKQHFPTSTSYNDDGTRDAKRAAERHCAEMNAAEENLKKTGGNFAW